MLRKYRGNTLEIQMKTSFFRCDLLDENINIFSQFGCVNFT